MIGPYLDPDGGDYPNLMALSLYMESGYELKWMVSCNKNST